jgi:hypothetical protein
MDGTMTIWRAMLRRNACEDWEALVERAAVGDLPAAAAAPLAAHVAGCARCRARIERGERLTRLLAGLPQPTWPAGTPHLPPAAAAVAAQSATSGRGGARRPSLSLDAIAPAARALRARPLVAASLLIAALAAAAFLAALFARPGRGVGPRRIELVSPREGNASAWGVATICAALDPPLSGESLRLRVDERDVTAASDLTPDFILYTTPEPLAPGAHLVALVVEDRAGDPIQERLWVVTAEREEGSLR